MWAYLILNYTIEDPETYAEYDAAAAQAWDMGVPFELVLADLATENLEGETGGDHAQLQISIEKDARKVYESEAYRGLIAKRLDTTSHHFGVLVDEIPT